MDRQKIKSLISDLRAIENELMRNATPTEDQDILHELKSCVDDLRTTIWATMSTGPADANRERFIEMVRMHRVVEMLRIMRRSCQSATPEKSSLQFSNVIRINGGTRPKSGTDAP
ncbi:MAG: hypothetical protein JWN45_3520 [Acidobacteriaceae bacterium]|nr:hypothetical protein [Acidobacteriaceae bacterium]